MADLGTDFTFTTISGFSGFVEPTDYNEIYSTGLQTFFPGTSFIGTSVPSTVFPFRESKTVFPSSS